jgi:hypothetical protein
MTKVFDDNSRLTLASRLIPDNLEYNGQPVSSLTIRKVPASFAREYISTYHYTKTMPDSTMFCFAGYYSEALAGVIVFGMGAGKNQYTALVPNIQNGEYLELTRLWSPDGMPKNTESKLITESINLLPSQIKLIISFADPSRNHIGTIYQASNFYYCGMSQGGKVLIGNDGIEKHPRLLGIYRMRHPEYTDLSNDSLMTKYGWRYKDSSPKYRYVLLRGDRKTRKLLLNSINPLIEPYPKLAGEVSRVTSVISNNRGRVRLPAPALPSDTVSGEQGFGGVFSPAYENPCPKALENLQLLLFD